MKTAPADGEKVIKEGSANLFRGWEGVGGKLCLTNYRLVFEPHSINFQTAVLIVPLDQIADLEKGWTKILGAIPVLPNLLIVKINNGTDYQFALYGREKWISAIKDCFPK